MPMDLMNTQAIFIQTMNNLFIDMLDKGVVIFLDDVLIYSTMAEECFELLEKGSLYLCKHISYCKLKTCSFLQKTTTFLRFDITP